MPMVVGIDNYNRDHISDILHKSGLSDYEAEFEAKIMNANSGPHASRYYVVKPDDHVLYKWEP